MRRRIVGALVLLLFAWSPARAQQELLDSCTESAAAGELAGQFELLCAQVVNSITDLQPSIGMAFSGGNPVLGTGSTIGMRMGSIPHVSVTARANATLVDLPDVFASGVGFVDDTNPTLGALETVGFPIGAVQGDIAIGLFNGVDVGPMVGGIGAIDLLGSVAYVPKFDEAGLKENIMNFGAGARVGLLKQGLVAPGISLSGMYRRMGTVEFGDRDAGDPADFSTNLSTLSTRAVISKGIVMVDLAVGAGYDMYTSDVAFGWRLQCETTDCLAATGDRRVFDGDAQGELSTSAWNVFGNVALNVLVLNIVGEVGYQKAIDRVSTADLGQIAVDPADLTTEELPGGRLFGSVGVRISL